MATEAACPVVHASISRSVHLTSHRSSEPFDWDGALACIHVRQLNTYICSYGWYASPSIIHVTASLLAIVKLIRLRLNRQRALCRNFVDEQCRSYWPIATLPFRGFQNGLAERYKCLSNRWADATINWMNWPIHHQSLSLLCSLPLPLPGANSSSRSFVVVRTLFFRCNRNVWFTAHIMDNVSEIIQ